MVNDFPELVKHQNYSIVQRKKESPGLPVSMLTQKQPMKFLTDSPVGKYANVIAIDATLSEF